MAQRQLAAEDVPERKGMPMLGLGTWENDAHDACVESVRTALEMGYRHIDTAQAYGNEDAVGEGIEKADVPREDVFLATKVWNDNLSSEDVIETTQQSLEDLGVEYVDLLYIHWPAGDYDPEETLGAFEGLVAEGKIERIGLSNFEPENLETAQEVLDESVFANQVELSPLWRQEELREYCEKADIELVAYSPLARGEVFDVEELTEIAEKHDASEVQVSLAWLREKGITAIPKATGEDHIRSNWESLEIELDEEDIEAIDSMDQQERQVDPDFAPW
ncbi:aldehyde oxidoreductase [Halobacteriales archaeon QS_3_64_16]|nr:MAG: aldehyde oxidoreductase [Halobacteriales archaeon QS_3_64_16]